MACVADREAAVREVAQVYELIKLHQPLLLLHSQQAPPPPPSTIQLAQNLLGQAQRALNVALSVMKHQQQQPAVASSPVTPISVIKAEPHQLSPPSPASADPEATRGAKRRRSSVPPAQGKKAASSSWATLTAVPYDDGYEWRKYGEKKINGALFTRSYFRCTYKDDAGCLATKHVQQVDDDDSSSGDGPLMFHVTYNNDHTCCNASAVDRARAAAPNTGGSSNLAALLAAGCCDGSGRGTGKGLTTSISARPTGHQHAAAMNMKQEEPRPLLLPLPPLVEPPPASFPYGHQTMPIQCQQEPLFPPTSMEQQLVCGALRDHGSPADGGEIPSATGSCISGETCWWDGYSGDMEAQMAAAEDDPLHDLERFLMRDSFMDC
ncbi:putative WRKY transcription factor 70 [Zea mays]|uniref:Putative WRKY transcription factor 70 n=1 Tax=Zea mays TaxID=4577 RepID=A0A3L6F6D6_MAIZE|nr:putative WRKY transcription factor 70 [Zea mays]